MVDLALDEADVELEVGDLAGDLFGVGDLEGERGAGCSRMKRATSGTAT